MVKQFVDHFKIKEFGFNFFPVLGLIIAWVLTDCVRLAYFTLRNLVLKGHTITYHPNPVNVLYPLLFGLCLLWLVHAVKEDFYFPVIFGLAYMAVGLLIRLIGYHSYAYGESFYESVRLTAYLFNVRTLLGGFLYALAVGLGLVILYSLFKRLDYAILVAFPAGEFISYFFNVVVEIIAGGKFTFEADWFFLGLAEGVLYGLFFYVGYILYMRARGWRVIGTKFEHTGEETAPRTNLLSRKVFFGLISALTLLELAIVFAFLSFNNFRQMQIRLNNPVFQRHGLETLVIPLLALALLILAILAVVYVLFILRKWTALQDGQTGTSPAMAAGFLFIPVFNLYWVFKVFYGFAQDHNALIDRHRLNVPKLPWALYITMSILVVANVLTLPLYGFTQDMPLDSLAFQVLVLVSILQVTVTLAMVYLTCQAVNRIPAEFYRRGPAARPQ